MTKTKAIVYCELGNKVNYTIKSMLCMQHAQYAYMRFHTVKKRSGTKPIVTKRKSLAKLSLALLLDQ